MFLALSGVIGKSQKEVEQSLANYATQAGGGLQKENLSSDHKNFCVIQETNGNTTVVYPDHYLEWDKSSAFLSKELNAPVFSLHIHDGDLWMYVLYVNGHIIDQFNPIPEYWDDSISQEEIDSWKGNASLIAQHIPNVTPQSIQNYLIRWEIDMDGQKAYEDDQYMNEDWQLLDFMRKVGLPYPLDGHGNPLGTVYNLWTKEIKQPAVQQTPPKKWWKFWQ